MSRYAIPAVALGAFLACATAQERHHRSDEDVAGWQRGEQLAYRTRPGEESSRLVIVHRESESPLGVVYVVSVDKLTLANSEKAGDSQFCLTIAADALRASALDRIGRVDVDAYKDCEEGWREHWGKGEVRVEEQSVAAALDYVDETIRRTSKSR